MAIDKFKDFKFTGPVLDDLDIPRIGASIGVGEDIVHGVMDTEAGGKSVDKNGRMKALYEPHVAYRNSKGAVRAALVKAGLAYPKWKKGYPADSYPRIKKAMAIDETVALLATSWGFPQVLGENFATAGYESVQEMVLDFLADEDNQLEGMIRFIKGAHLDDELRVLEKKLKSGKAITPDDARPFVRGYNGAAYEKNDYHTTFATNVNKWAKIKDTPYSPAAEATVVIPKAVGDDVIKPAEVAKIDLYDGKEHPEVRAVQEKLDALGYPEVGQIDGKWGTRTRGVILAFRADNHLPVDGLIDDKLMAALMIATPRYVAPDRKTATLDDLRKEGAEDVKAADKTDVVAYATLGTGVLGGAGKVANQLEGYSGVIKRIADAVEPVQGFVTDNFWLLAIGVGGLIIWQTGILKKIRLDKHQTGNDVSI